MEIPFSGAQAPLLQHGIPVSLSFTMVARSRGSFGEDALPGALSRLRERNPLTAVRIAPTADGLGH